MINTYSPESDEEPSGKEFSDGADDGEESSDDTDGGEDEEGSEEIMDGGVDVAEFSVLLDAGFELPVPEPDAGIREEAAGFDDDGKLLPDMTSDEELSVIAGGIEEIGTEDVTT